MNLFLEAGKTVVGTAIETSTAGVITNDDLFGNEDTAIEEEQLVQLIQIRKALEYIARRL